MHFKASDVFQYYKPSKCAKRVALHAQGAEPDEEEDPFADLLADLGLRHEKSHLATLTGMGVVDLSSRDLGTAERAARTREAMADGAAAIYQAGFSHTFDLDGEPCELVGEPDFLIRQADGSSGAGAGYLIRDSKLAHRPLASNHAGIPLQLQIYGYLYEHATGAPPTLEVHAGTGEIVPIEYRGAESVLDLLREHRRLRALDPDVYEPVGWSKCDGCGFHKPCWTVARTSQDVAILPTVDQPTARELHRRAIATIPELDAAFDTAALRDLFWIEATKKKPARLKPTALRLRRSLDAHLSGAPVQFSPLDLPAPVDIVAFDLEGLPAYADELQKIYLWGLKAFDTDPPRFMPALADFGERGDRDAWQAFLRTAAALLAKRPTLRFVHWGTYETAALDRYVERHGDFFPPLPAGEGGGEGVAAHIRERCLDLHRLFKTSVALPVESYGLKAIGRYLGFVRKLPDYQGGLAIARYIQAVETEDAALRAQILDEILAYNEEDLDATRAAMEWLRGLSARR